MDFDFGYSFGLPSALSPFARLIPTLAGSQYGTFSYTFTDTGKIKHTYATTQTGIEYDLSDGYTVTAGNVFSTPAAVTDILVDDISVGLGGAAPNDGKIHVVTFVVNAGAAIAYLWQDGTSSAFFVGQYLRFELIDTSTASDIVINNFVFDSGSTTEQFARGSTTDKIILINFTTIDWNRYTQQRNIAHDAGVIGEAWVGDNVVVNGRFNTDTDWTKLFTATISGGFANFFATNDIIETNLSIINSGDIYISEFDLSGTGIGTGIAMFFNNFAQNVTGTVNIIRRYTIKVAATTSGNVRFQAQAGVTDMQVDNVSVRHLLEVA